MTLHFSLWRNLLKSSLLKSKRMSVHHLGGGRFRVPKPDSIILSRCNVDCAICPQKWPNSSNFSQNKGFLHICFKSNFVHWSDLLHCIHIWYSSIIFVGPVILKKSFFFFFEEIAKNIYCRYRRGKLTFHGNTLKSIKS